MASFKSGFVSILGRPNVGKSTLFNRLVGEKIAIVTDKPQTTRNRILGIKNVGGGQFIFLDTPGLHEGKSELNQRMVQTAIAAAWDANVVLFIIDALSPSPEKDRSMLESLKAGKRAVFLVINKIDRVKKQSLLPIIGQYQRLYPFERIIPVSSRSGEGVEILLNEILKTLRESPPYFPDDTLTDQTERFWVSEIIREKAIQHSYQEVPYSIAVTLEAFMENLERNLVVIRGTIHVEKQSQKKIIIGKGGQRLKRIGEAARREVETFLERRVFLELWVNVEKNWTHDPCALNRLGYPAVSLHGQRD